MRKALLGLVSVGTFLATTAVVGCGSSSKPAAKPSNTKASACSPGTYFSCVNGSCNGHTTCLSDGSGYAPCVCDAQGGAGGAMPQSDAGPGPGNSFDGGAIVPDAGTTTPTPKATCHGTEQCVSAATGGFAGPVALYVGKATPPKCDAAFALKVLSAGADPQGDPATCSSCSCTPSNATCPTFLDFATSAAPSCADPTCTTSISASCVEISPPCIAGISTASLKTKLASAPSKCKASKQTPTTADAAFGKQVIACAVGDAQRLDCKKDEVCAAEPSAKFQAQLCIWKAGNVACPAGDYSDHRVYYQKLHDTRSCSACSCDGPDCTMAWHVFDASDTTCATPVISLSSAEQCVQVNPASDKLRVGVTIGGSGACAPQGGAAEGTVTGDSPVTVCCLP